MRKSVFDVLPLPEGYVWWERPIYSVGCPFCHKADGCGYWHPGDICDCGAVVRSHGWMMKAVTKEWAKDRKESWG